MYNYTVTQKYNIIFFFTRGLKPGTHCIPTYPYYHLVPLKVQPQYFLFCKDRKAAHRFWQFAVWAIQISCCKSNPTDSSTNTSLWDTQTTAVFSPTSFRLSKQTSKLRFNDIRQEAVECVDFWHIISVIKSMARFFHPISISPINRSITQAPISHYCCQRECCACATTFLTLCSLNNQCGQFTVWLV